MYDKHLGAEFQSEINTLTEVGHLNLVKFYGYLVHEDEKLVVVEYVPNGTLREHLECKYSLPHCLVDVCECLFLFPIFCPWLWVWGDQRWVVHSFYFCITEHVFCINTGMHGTVLDFAARLDVAIDVAHAVTYLHMYSGMCNSGNISIL